MTFEEWQAVRAGRTSRAAQAPAVSADRAVKGGALVDEGAAGDPVAGDAVDRAAVARPVVDRAATGGSEAGTAAVVGPAVVGPSAEAARAAAALLSEARDLLDRAESLLAPLCLPDAASAEHDDAALVATVDLAERVTAIAGAVGTRASVAYRTSQVARRRALGMPARDLGRGIADEIALARRISPARASNALALGRVLVESLPRTFRLLARGEISTWAAEEVAKAALTLGDPDRARVDEDLAEHLPQVSARRAGALARARAQELDQEAALARMRREVAQRHVSIRPVSDAMVRISALLPTPEGVAVYAALDRRASAARAAGSERTRGQEMADDLVRCVTGLDRIEDAGIEIQLIMTDTTLLGGADDAAWIAGRPIPGSIARHLALADGGGKRDADGTPAAARTRRWVRRLYTDPVTGSLREADGGRRLFTGAVRSFVTLRDQQCRVPWCDAPIRHVHHVEGYAEGGETVAGNGAGTCERFNYVAQMPGWTTDMLEGDLLRITTPTGREYLSSSPVLRIPGRLVEGARGSSGPDRTAGSAGASPAAEPPRDADTATKARHPAPDPGSASRASATGSRRPVPDPGSASRASATGHRARASTRRSRDADPTTVPP